VSRRSRVEGGGRKKRRIGVGALHREEERKRGTGEETEERTPGWGIYSPGGGAHRLQLGCPAQTYGPVISVFSPLVTVLASCCSTPFHVKSTSRIGYK